MVNHEITTFDEDIESVLGTEYQIRSDYVSKQDVLLKAIEYYRSSRSSLYAALACTIIWYEISKTDTPYINKIFAEYKSKKQTHVYTTAIKATMDLDEDRQASTISKYKDAAINMMAADEFANSEITEYSDELVEKMVQFIKDAGGLDKLAALGKKADADAKDDSKDDDQRDDGGRSGLTSAEIDQIAEKMLKRRRQAKYSFTFSKGELPAAPQLLVLIGRTKGDTVEILDMAPTEPNLVKSYIRKTHQSKRT